MEKHAEAAHNPLLLINLQKHNSDTTRCVADKPAEAAPQPLLLINLQIQHHAPLKNLQIQPTNRADKPAEAAPQPAAADKPAEAAPQPAATDKPAEARRTTCCC